jgi:hypothetical protein
MLNQKLRRRFVFSGLSLMAIIILALTIGAFVAAAAPVEPQPTVDQAGLPPAQNDDDEDEDQVEPLPPVDPARAAEDIRVIFEEMTLVQLLSESEEYYALTACAGNGLNHIEPSAEGPKVLIPNAGDLSVAGSNVAIKLSPEGEITFIPRTQGQMIRVPMDVGDKVADQEVLSLTLDEAQQLMLAGQLVWTAKDQGPNGNGHGLPGHIAACDPAFNEDQYEDFIDENGDEA